MAKILKNTTDLAIFLDDTGVMLPTGPSEYTIPPEDYGMWAGSTGLHSYIQSGDVVINDGLSDLEASLGINYVQGQPVEVARYTGTEKDYLHHMSVEEHLELNRIGSGKVGIAGLPYTGIIGASWTVVYASTATIKNAYLQIYKPSNQASFMLPYSGTLYAISVDTQDNTTADFYVCVRKKSDLSTNIATLHKPTGQEYAYKSDYDVSLQAGDRLSVYIEEGSSGNGKAAKPVVALFGALE